LRGRRIELPQDPHRRTGAALTAIDQELISHHCADHLVGALRNGRPGAPDIFRRRIARAENDQRRGQYHAGKIGR
jgi:hypothetical protein